MEYCAICKHSNTAHSLGGCCSELKTTATPEPNPAVFVKGCTCAGFVPKGQS